MRGRELSVALFIASVLVGAALLAALLPLLAQDDAASAVPQRVHELELERDRLVASLKEIDLDLAMGKIAAEDHAELKHSTETRAIAVIETLERERGAS